MKRRLIIGSLVAGTLLVGAISNVSEQPQSSNSNASQSQSQSINTTPVAQETIKEIPTCDGTSITANCTINGVSYATYVYHAAVPEESHDETVTTYSEEISGYCTLCSDGTYSPSCATGRGACSHHGGVAEWNAPRYRNVPQYSTKKVIDAPAQVAYYQKVTQ